MTVHTPVLLKETIDSLDLAPNKVFLDGTVGGGGHSAEVAQRFGDTVKIIALDKSRSAAEQARKRLSSLSRNVTVVEESFRNLDKVLEDEGVGKADAILLDLGISSDQLEESGRGFSFQRDEPLLMTMKDTPDENDLTAAKILNEFDEETLELIIRGFGEEKYSKRIAQAIVEWRTSHKFEKTSDLLELIEATVPTRGHVRINPATRTFQALRIAVNEELIALEVALEKGFQALVPGGRFAVISFHSLEDRMVKNSFRNHAETGEATIITKKPVVPSEEEIAANPRSRSAKLRVLQKK